MVLMVQISWIFQQEKQKQVKIRNGLGEIDKETFELTIKHLQEEIQKIESQLPRFQPQLSNLNKMIDVSLEKASNISKIWASSDLENKRNLCKLLFPGGIYYDVKNHIYLTKEMNQYFKIIHSLSEEYKSNKKGNSQDFPENSLSVARTRFELVTSGL